MTESKVVRYDLKLEHCDLIKQDRSGRFVTHADYKALEEELASLKARVAELVEADELKKNEVEDDEYCSVCYMRGCNGECMGEDR